MRVSTLNCLLVVACVILATGPAMAGNAYGHYKHDPGSDPLSDNWTCDTSYNPDTGEVSVGFTIDNMPDVISAGDTVLCSWSNITIDPVEEIYINSLQIGLMGDPEVDLVFGVTGGKTNVTTFHILSPLLEVQTHTDCIGYATAAVTVTDYLLLRNGATANGLFAGDFYEARYNTSAVYDDLVPGPISVGSTGTASATGSETGEVQSFGTVTSMQTEFAFNITPRDQVSGTSAFAIEGTIVPEPASAVALLSGVIGLLGVIRRRR